MIGLDSTNGYLYHSCSKESPIIKGKTVMASRSLQSWEIEATVMASRPLQSWEIEAKKGRLGSLELIPFYDGKHILSQRQMKTLTLLEMVCGTC